ncbi:ABC transporter substrate-binding protein [Brucella pseudogrignonensis]|uniref:ABC transporter substrate-binding protein n=1 Tax=Brucella pseudogrignonensis TaxID=419475 RepID=UPI001E5F53B9|nr:ABC transporter substrate-binding protein [Brucella pseudogrignonensis]MCD4514352.1 ABC transporter substrate-binding protein [Brucella pseudogrignonensis]
MGLLQRRTVIKYLASAVLTATGAASAAEKYEGEFPVTVDHKFGSTIVPTRPQRLLTIGSHDEDAALILGEAPIGLVTYNVFHEGLSPWAQKRLSGSAPAALSPLLDFEQIAALRPDLILAVCSGINALDWDRLSRIAPTVAYSARPWASDWREQLTVAGMVLGRRDEADLQISLVDDLVSEVANRHPELRGRSICLAIQNVGSRDLTVMLENNPTFKVFAGFGLRPCSFVKQLGVNAPQQTTVAVSSERIDGIDADLLLMWSRPARGECSRGASLFDLVPAVRNGRLLSIENKAHAEALAAPTVLSIPYAYPEIASKLATLIGGRSD